MAPLRKGIATLPKVCIVNYPFSLSQENLQPFTRVLVLPVKKLPALLGIMDTSSDVTQIPGDTK